MKNTASTSSTRPRRSAASSKWGDEWVDKHDISSLRLLGTVGEGITPKPGCGTTKRSAERLPIVDTWWRRPETGGIMMSAAARRPPTKPGSCCKPLPGIVPEVVGSGKPVPTGSGGWLTITQRHGRGCSAASGATTSAQGPVPGATCRASTFAATMPTCDEDGYYWIMGRIDDVLNVSGHRLNTIEIESALVSRAVAEAAAVGRPPTI